MSLLDDASIVVTPNGYKQGVLFSVIPSSGAADLEVTRGTAATRVDEDGLVNYAQVISDTDLVTNGDFATDSNWTKGGNWSIGGGVATSNANGNSNISQNIPLTVGTDYSVTYTVVNASAGSRIGISTNATSIQIERTTDGTYTETFTATLASFYIRALWNNGSPVSVDNVSVKKVDLDNVPRIDYTGGGCPHILAEPQRTNVNTYSEDFSQSFYIKDSGISVASTNNVSPSGESNATEIEVDNNGRIYANVASDTYSTSVFIKAGTFAYFKFGGSNVDLVAGTYSGGTIESFGNGWFKITKAYTGNRPFQIQAYPDGTYSSHTTNGNYYIWGGQAEIGSYPTSYIPTSGSTVTRNQDIFTRDGIGSLINSEEGVLFVEMAALTDDSTNRMLSLYGSGNDKITLFYKTTSNSMTVQGFVGGSLQINRTIVLTDITQFSKIAIRYKTNDFAWYVDGVKITTDTSTNTWSADTLNKLSFDDGGGGNPLFAKVKQLQVYKTALTDTQLAALTS